MYLAKVYITFKPTVNDPEGQTIQGSLHQLGFNSVNQVRSGKYMEIRFDEANGAAASAKMTSMCDQLLANPIMENYRFEIKEIS